MEEGYRAVIPYGRDPFFDWDRALCPPSYVRDHLDVLGVDLGPLRDYPRCFNCGGPDHSVSSCSEPRNQQLITLSRQLYDFLKSSKNQLDTRRLFDVEKGKRQRLEWLEEFEPGKIKGPLLREALRMNDNGDDGRRMPWLANMTIWGYPKGWVSVEDPKIGMWRRITEQATALSSTESDEDEDEDDLFLIHGEEVTEELQLSTQAYSLVPRMFKVESDDGSDGFVSEPLKDQTATSLPKRWAKYPDTYFSYSALSVYRGAALTPTGPRQHNGNGSRRYPYRTSRGPSPATFKPSPPSTTPPPLPPCPTPPPPPLLLPSQLHPLMADLSVIRPSQYPNDDSTLGECDMDMSDSD